MLKLALIYLVVLVTSCMTVPAAQTGRVLGTGKTGGYMGFGMLSGATMDSETGTTQKSDSIAMISGIRHGFSETVDLGMRGNSLGLFSMEGKVRLVSNQEFALATGLGVGYGSHRKSSDYDNGNPYSIAVLTSDLPIYWSYDLSKSSSLYGSLRYFFAKNSNQSTKVDPTDDSYSRFAIVSVGLMQRGSVGYFGEVVHMKDLTKDASYTQLDIVAGLVFGEGTANNSQDTGPTRAPPAATPRRKKAM